MQQEFSSRIKLSDIKLLTNYRDYEQIWVYTPSDCNNLHIGYMDNTFFAFTRQAYGAGIDIDEPKSVVDYYIDKTYFKIESIEKDMISLNERYKGYKHTLDNYIALHYVPTVLKSK